MQINQIEWDRLQRRDKELQAIQDAWNNASSIPAASWLTGRDVLKRNWPSLAAAIKDSLIQENTNE
jgi:hypothetical protein